MIGRRWLGALAGAVMLAGHGEVRACSMLQQRIIDDMDKGVSGYCSNNGQPITCRYTPGDGWTCEGPQGAYSAMGDLGGLVARTCGCSIQDEGE